MTTVNPSTTGAASTATKAGAPNTLSSASAAEQQDRFMKLLVAQMKNQDPLSPMDNAQMTSQIAQINTVGGIEKLNRTVESLLAAFTSVQSQSATQLPGRTVLVEGSGIELVNGESGGGGGVAGVELATAADAVNVDIIDAAGTTVRSLALGKLDAGVRSFGWDGLTTGGDAAPAGTYRTRITATAAGKDVTATALTAVRVQAVSTNAGGVQLDLGSAGSRAYSDVKSFL